MVWGSRWLDSSCKWPQHCRQRAHVQCPELPQRSAQQCALWCHQLQMLSQVKEQIKPAGHHCNWQEIKLNTDCTLHLIPFSTFVYFLICFGGQIVFHTWLPAPSTIAREPSTSPAAAALNAAPCILKIDLFAKTDWHHLMQDLYIE